MTLLILITQILFVPVFSPLLIGLIRTLKARLQNRRGADIIQPYRDLWKLFQKNEIVSNDASWLFRAAPRIIFAITLVLSVFTPLFIVENVFSDHADIIVVISFFALTTLMLALSGLDVGNAFGGLGSSREAALTAITEGALLFSLLPITFLCGSTNLFDLLGANYAADNGGAIILLLSGLAFCIALLAENARYPFDNPSTHLELTMVHEAMLIEHSGGGLALMEWAAANKLMIFAVMFVNIFVPFGVLPAAGMFTFVAMLALVLIKISFVGAGIALLESTIPKLRYFKLFELLFTSFALGLIALVIAIL